MNGTTLAKRLLPLAALVMLATGCTARSKTFPGQSMESVWTAMVAAAESPDYNHPDYTERWTVRENDVWADEETGRIEIARRVERLLRKPRAVEQYDERAWKFTITLLEVDVPTVTFDTRNLGVPAHAWIEAERYFADVEQLLESGEPAPPAGDS